MLLTQVDPETLVKPGAPGRGAWRKPGIEFNYRYALAPTGSPRIGTVAERSLDHWAAAAGCDAIQRRLVALGHMAPVGDGERGIFGPRTDAGVRAFQAANVDPKGGAALVVDGIVGMSDARALFLPLVVAAEAKYKIPRRLLLGQTNHESVLDPGCLGFFIYYDDDEGNPTDYRGVDRGMSQINSRFNPQVTWLQAFDPAYALDWSAKRLRDYFDRYRTDYPGQPGTVLWDAAVCAHNNPSAARRWASEGFAPTQQAADYVAAVKSATF